mgnify:CR=1 FL=1
MLDAHIHIDFYDDVKAVIQELSEYKVTCVFVTHVPELYAKYASDSFLKKHPNIHLALGYHPSVIGEYELDKNLFCDLIKNASFIGEVGLDYMTAKSDTTRESQRRAFDYICKMASGKIFTVHSRWAESDTLSILKRNDVKNAIFHWYTGNEKTIDDIVDCGYYFSINPAMLKTTKGRKCIDKIPVSRMLVESDGPFVKYDGKIIRPKDLGKIYKELGEYLGNADIEDIVSRNFVQICSNSIL